MPAHHKGERRLLSVRPPAEVVTVIEKMWRESGVSSVSQYVADIMALHAGRPDLVRELGKVGTVEGVLPLAM